ncbi:peptidase S1 and S6, chymotrypsin/Hap [Frankia casuarinae]|uniref:Peptidase S1 and S6, chymotrypsin/Hap n=2 Tax=Frankiaceae TaxID=74712 RepID=Q2JGX9_FRACC|nr:trypsin-like peptidase domain-containing protein [Frankia sp. Allo2]ABD09463.1 peptidase S1 and S6, chymotrypsin/Hap [Frankia casuarinae]
MTPRLPFSSSAEAAPGGGGREGSGAGHDSPSPWAPPIGSAAGTPAGQAHPAGPASSEPDLPAGPPSRPPGSPYSQPPALGPSSGQHPQYPNPHPPHGDPRPYPDSPYPAGPSQASQQQAAFSAGSPPPAAPPGGPWGPPSGPPPSGPAAPRALNGAAGPAGPPAGPPTGGHSWGPPWSSPSGAGSPPAQDLYGNGTTMAASPPWRRRRLVAAGLAIALVSAGVGGGVGALVADNNGGQTIVTSAGLHNTVDSSGGTSPAAANTVSAAAQKILPSVVTISEESSSESGTGSGTIIRSDGHILTNNHVVSGAANGGSLTVTLQDGRTFDAQVVGTDPSSDLAMIKINATGLTAATFGNSDTLNIGELVVAVGSPLGLNGTVTSGIVSAVHRPVRTGDSTVRDQQNTVLDAIQTDASINPGNSGGPLVNSRGEIIGVNSAIATVGGGSPFGGGQQSGNIGVGFAIPGNYAESVATQLISTGSARHPYLGVSASTAEENTRSTASSGNGAQIRSMVPGGPAERAGLRTGDVITKVGNRAVNDVDSLIAAVRSHAIGDEVEVTYTRDGQSGTVKARLAQQPPAS